MPKVRHLVLTAVAALALAACSSGSSSGSQAPGPQASGSSGGTASACKPSTQTGSTAVTIQNFAYSPSTVQAKVGQPVTWTNKDSINHGAVLDNDPSCTTGPFGNGATGSLVFSAPGTYTYHCPVHGTSMKGTVQVSS